MEAHRTPDARFDGLPAYPFTPHFLDQDGLRMHYLDEGQGDPVLLLHGDPTWSFLYRRVVAVLVSTGHRAVVPDLFGFGRSDKPLATTWYSYDRHCRSLERLAFDHLDLRRVTLVVHDWGGPIGLRLAAEHEERIDRLVLTNTGVDAGTAPSQTWLRFRAMVRKVGGALDIGRLVQSGCSRELPADVLRAYDAPFPTPASKAGVLAFAELVPTEPDHPNAAPMRSVRERMRAWTKPALVLFGDSDPIFPPDAAERMAALVPGAGPAELVPDASHFLHEDAGEAVGERIAAWLAATGSG